MSILKPVKRSLAVVACASLLGVFGAHAADPYKINVILPLTGGAAFLGKGEQQTLQLLQSTVNKEGGISGQPLEFVFHDDQTNPQTTVQIANGILAEKPAVMLGSSIVAMCNAMAPLLKEGPFDYCLSPGVHPAPGKLPVFNECRHARAHRSAGALFPLDRQDQDRVHDEHRRLRSGCRARLR